jgi:hypothetical protein
MTVGEGGPSLHEIPDALLWVNPSKIQDRALTGPVFFCGRLSRDIDTIRHDRDWCSQAERSNVFVFLLAGRVKARGPMCGAALQQHPEQLLLARREA